MRMTIDAPPNIRSPETMVILYIYYGSPDHPLLIAQHGLPGLVDHH
jgi:hypothetical protein